MVDSISQTSAGTSAILTDTQAQRSSTTTKESTSAGRSIDDVVDLSQAGRAAAELRNSGLSGKQFTDKLAQSLEQGKSLGDSFAARMKSGRQDTSDTSDFGAALRGAVSDILKSGKPGSVYDGVVSRLFKR